MGQQVHAAILEMLNLCRSIGETLQEVIHFQHAQAKLLRTSQMSGRLVHINSCLIWGSAATAANQRICIHAIPLSVALIRRAQHPSTSLRWITHHRFDVLLPLRPNSRDSKGQDGTYSLRAPVRILHDFCIYPPRKTFQSSTCNYSICRLRTSFALPFCA